MNGVARTIVGIMPPDFAYPARHVEVWLPLALDPAHTRPATLNLVGIGRLKRGVSAEAARADLARVLAHVGDYVQGGASPAAWQEAHIAPHVQSLRDSMVGPIPHLLWFVFGSVLLVLLVACTNVAGLLLVRAERGQVELAVRAALGSDFMGMLALTLSESVLLSVLGERYWPGANPLGKRVRLLGGRWYTIVGEVGDVHYDRLEEPVNAIVYLPIVVAQQGAEASLPPALSLVVRTDAREGETLSAIRGIVRALDPAIPTYDEGSLNELVRDVSARARALVVLLAIAGIMTSLLGAVGLYGTMAYSVSIRRRELGIRMALVLNRRT